MGTINSAEEQGIREELVKSVPRGLHVDAEAMFPKLSGFGVEKKNRARLKLIEQHKDLLAKITNENEEIRTISPGIVNISWETFFMGVWAQFINRTLLVLTNDRLLLVHLNGKKAESFVNQVSLQAIKKFSSGLFSAKIQLGKGSISISGMPGAEKKQFAKLIKKNVSARGGVQHLCAKCFGLHAKHVLRCSHCQAEFKLPKTAALRSLILPGLGDFYLGHKALAVLEMFGSVITWIIALTLIVGGIDSGDPIVGVGSGLFILILANGFDAALTHAQAKKGLMALDGQLGGREAGFQRMSANQVD